MTTPASDGGEDPRLVEPTDNSTGAAPDLDAVEEVEAEEG